MLKQQRIINNAKALATSAIAAIIGCTSTSCGNGASSNESTNPMNIDEIEIAEGPLTPETIWKLGRVGDAQLSPDKKTLAFTITYTDIAEDKSYADIYTLPTSGGTPKRLTNTKENEYQIGWTNDGTRLTYLAARQENPQVWSIDLDGKDAKQITNIEGGIDAYRFAPDESKLIVVKRIKLDQTVNDIYPDLPKANARIETDLMYRHWNDWADYAYNHVLYVGLSNGIQKGEPIDIMEGERFHSPLMPFGGIEQINWTPDSKKIAYTCKKLTGKESAFSTNSNIYLYDTENGSTKNLTEDNKGYDMNPVFTADGKIMLWQSMEHDGYESDKNRLMMLNMETGKKTDLSSETENDVLSFALDADGKTIWITSDEKAKDAIFSIDIDSKKITRLTNDVCDYASVADAGDVLIASRMSMKAPSEIYSIDKKTGVATNISNVNTKALAKVEMGDIEERWVKTTDGKEMLVWVLYPPHFDKQKQYPALLYCQGGPQSTVSQFWSTRWNLELMAANGYVVVAPNRRGLPGFGREWCEQISGDYGGQNMKDYLAAIDNVASEPFVDANRLGAVGASYGGFSVYWLAGHHEKRFKAFIAHCGIFNFDQMNATTEEMFFVNWDMKGKFYEKNNAAAMKSFSQSPHLFVNNWDTPIMVIHGEKDFRIPYTQGMGAFNTAVMKDIPAQFLYFPEECHWVLRPQNSILWHREFYKWLDKWLK